ncbi:MAG: MFS transporter, partial [Thermomicrobiales bacterium]|nr:MFS transporter [Thermomicrobiales bacterium]
MDPEQQVRQVPVESAATLAAAAAKPGVDLRRFYVFQIVNEFNFVSAIWIIFLQSRGFTLSQIGLAESFFHLAPVTLELPSGSIADILGRKWSMAMGALLIAVSTAMMFVADSMWLLLPAMFLNGAAYAFRSGAQQAYLFDNLSGDPGGNRFTNILGKLNAFAYLAIAATSALGATLADRNYAWPFGLTVGFALAATWLAVGLFEPERPQAVRQSMAGAITEALRIVRGDRVLLALITFMAALWTVSALVYLYAQALLSERGMPVAQIGIFLSSSTLITALGAWLAGRLIAWRSFRFWAVTATAVVAGSGVVLAGAPLLAALIGLLLAEFFAGSFEPMVAQRINDAISSAQRATVISVESFFFSLTMVWAFPLFGWSAERWGWLPAYTVTAALAGLVLAAYL